MVNYEALERKRLELYKQYSKNNRVGLISILVAVLFIILAIILVDSAALPLFIIGFIGIIIAVIFFGKANSFRLKFRKFIKSELVDGILGTYFEKYSYYEKGHVDINATKRAGLVMNPDRYRGEDLITGEYKGLKFNVSDLVLEYRQVTRTKNGTTVTYVPYFTGRWYIYKFPKDLGNTLKIVERSGGTSTRGLKKYETEMMAFNKKFNIYSSDQNFFYQLITPYMIERLLLLENAHRGSIGYAFIGDELHIAVNDNSNSLELTFRKPINQANIIHFEEDIKLIKTIVDEFYLDDINFR